MNKNKIYWRICSALVIVLTIIVFTPLVIPQNVYKPILLGIPYSLWTSFLITVALVTITFIGTKIHSVNEEKDDEL